MKAQMKAADRSGADVAVIIGTSEVDAGVVTLRALRDERPQETVARAELVETVRKWLPA
jgi:histidyl-tRNA synthetase